MSELTKTALRPLNVLIDQAVQREAAKLAAAGVPEHRRSHKSEASAFGRLVALLGVLIVAAMAALLAIPLMRGDSVSIPLVIVFLIGVLFGLFVFGAGATLVSREAGGFLATLAEWVVKGIGTFRGKGDA